jgi:non-heme chloroperoxidase
MKICPSALVWFVAAIGVAHYGCNSDKKDPAAWRDPSPHSVQFVTVDKNVQLEVLDWGGSRRPLVLLAGLGNTAHIFDDFAPKLTAEYHVYGITRRGFGASSAPENGYSGNRLGDDVLAVLDSLKIKRPVLVGHSIAGEELNSAGSRYPERIAGLIYLDSIPSYDSSRGDFNVDLGELIEKLEQLQKLPADDVPKWKHMVDDLLKESLPRFERNLQALQKRLQTDLSRPPPAGPGDADLASFPALRSWIARIQGITMPEAELRQTHEASTDGRVGKQRSLPSISRAIVAGKQRHSNIRVPALAILAAVDNPDLEAQAKANGAPIPHVVRLSHADHFVFLSNEEDVLREMKAFLGSLP